MKTIVASFCAISLLAAAGCSSSKELNERSARSLIKERLSSVHYPIAVSIIAPLMTRLPVSYGTLVEGLKTKGVKENVAAYIVKRLLDAGLVTERVDTINYPNIHGKFRSEARYELDEYSLSMVPNTNRLTGFRDQQCQSCANRHESKVNGTVDENGLVTLPNGRFRYKEDGGAAYLMDTDRFNITNYKGTVSGSMVGVKWYNYSFSPGLKAQIETTPMPTFGGLGTTKQETLDGGSYAIGEVSDLRLGLTPTMAAASFAWTVSLNKIGRLFYGADTPKGDGRVTFARKPDETWAIENWCVSNCAF